MGPVRRRSALCIRMLNLSPMLLNMSVTIIGYYTDDISDAGERYRVCVTLSLKL